MTANALEKRIKRRITGRVHRFFISTAPGLKQACLNEVRPLMPDVTDVEQIQGGIEFSGRLNDCCRANLHLRTPSRVTMRLTAFKAENFRTLEKKLKDMEWELYLRQNTVFRVEVSTRKCRLYHTGAIVQRTEPIILNHIDTHDALPSDPGSYLPQTVFIRGVNDRFELSLDSSGDLLHKRGLKQEVGAAPVRETLACAILRSAGYTGSEFVLDPMCGSGTFSLEAAMMCQNIPPGFFRRFAFESWPGFSPGAWRHLKREAVSKFTPDHSPGIVASDLDTKCLSALIATLEEFNLSSMVQVEKKDFFQLKPGDYTKKPGIIVLNPPYGLRLGSNENNPSLYREIGKKLKLDFKGWRAGVIVPEKELITLLPIIRPQVMPCFHGGLDIIAVSGIIA